MYIKVQIHLNCKPRSRRCWENWRETLKMCFSWHHEEGNRRREEEPRYGCPHLVLWFHFFYLFVLFLFCGFVNEVCEGEALKLCEDTLLTSAEKKKKKKKRPKDEAALKSNQASAAAAGATTRVQAQRCNKEEGGWITEEEERVWGGYWWRASSDVSLCSVPPSLSHGNTHTHTHGKARTELHRRHTAIHAQTCEISNYPINFWWPIKVVFILAFPFPKWEVTCGMQRETPSVNRKSLCVSVCCCGQTGGVSKLLQPNVPLIIKAFFLTLISRACLIYLLLSLIVIMVCHGDGSPSCFV